MAGRPFTRWCSDNNLCWVISTSGYTPIPLQQECTTIHNVGYFFQIAKVPSGVCKFSPAFVLDSVTFVAMAKCSQMQLHVGNLFHFPQKFVGSLRTQHNKHTSVRIWYAMKQERKTTLMRTFVRIYCDMVENERNARRLYYESYDPYTNVIRYWRIREELADNVARFT